MKCNRNCTCGSAGLQAFAALFTFLAAIFYAIAVYRNDAIIQSETLSQYDQYETTCGINATFKQLKKTDGTHANYVTLDNAVDDCKYEDLQTNILTAQTAGTAIFYPKSAMQSATPTWTAGHVEKWEDVCLDGWNPSDRGYDPWKSDNEAAKRSQYLGVVGISDLHCRALPTAGNGLDHQNLDAGTWRDDNIAFAADVLEGSKSGLTLEMCAYAIQKLHSGNRNDFEEPGYNPGYNGDDQPVDHWPGRFDPEYDPHFVYAKVPIQSFAANADLHVADGQGAYVHTCIGVHSKSDEDAAARVFGNSLHRCQTRLQPLTGTQINMLAETLDDDNNHCFGLSSVDDVSQIEDCDEGQNVVRTGAGALICQACPLGGNVGNVGGDQFALGPSLCDDCIRASYPTATGTCATCLPVVAATVVAGAQTLPATSAQITPVRGRLNDPLGRGHCFCPENTCVGVDGRCDPCIGSLLVPADEAGTVCTGGDTSPARRAYDDAGDPVTDQRSCGARRDRRDDGEVGTAVANITKEENPSRRRRLAAGFVNSVVYTEESTRTMLSSITDMCQAAILMPARMRQTIDYFDSDAHQVNLNPALFGVALTDEMTVSRNKVKSLAPMAVLAMWDKGDKLLQRSWDVVLESYQSILNQGNTYSSGDCEVAPTGDVYTQAARMNEFFDTATTYTGLLCYQRQQGGGPKAPGGMQPGYLTAVCNNANGLTPTDNLMNQPNIPSVGLTDLLGEGDHLFLMMGSSYILPTTSLHSVNNVRWNAATCTNKCKKIKTIGNISLLIGGVVFILLILMFVPALAYVSCGDAAPSETGKNIKSTPITMLAMLGLMAFAVLLMISGIMQAEPQSMAECGFTSLAGALGHLPKDMVLTEGPDQVLTTFKANAPQIGIAGIFRWCSFTSAVVVIVLSLVASISFRSEDGGMFYTPFPLNTASGIF